MPVALFEQQIIYKISKLTPIEKQTVYEFVDFLLNKQARQPTVRKAALLDISVWDEQAIEAIEEAQEQINAWNPPVF